MKSLTGAILIILIICPNTQSRKNRRRYHRSMKRQDEDSIPATTNQINEIISNGLNHEGLLKIVKIVFGNDPSMHDARFGVDKSCQKQGDECKIDDHDQSIYGRCVVIDCLMMKIDDEDDDDNEQNKGKDKTKCIKLNTLNNFPKGIKNSISICAAKNPPLDDVNTFDRDQSKYLKLKRKFRLKKRIKKRIN